MIVDQGLLPLFRSRGGFYNSCSSTSAALLGPMVQAIEKLKLDNDSPPPGTRPKALGMETCVGIEYVPFKKPLPLENKVRGMDKGEKEASSHRSTQ